MSAMSAMFDKEGRLFGRINLIDAAIVLVVVVIIPVGIAAYRLFSVSRPEIARIEPAVLTVDGDHHLQLEGRNFRPYLKAFFFRTGAPFSLSDPGRPDSGLNQAPLRVATPSKVELTLPSVAPGTYDLYLYDEAREVAKRLSAFTVAPRGEQTPGLVAADATVPVDVDVRFVVTSAVAPLVKPGDAALVPAQIGGPPRPPALVSVRKTTLEDHVTFVARGAMLVAAPGDPGDPGDPGNHVRIDAVVRFAAIRRLGVWEAGQQRLRAGETLSFETPLYSIAGIITRVVVAP